MAYSIGPLSKNPFDEDITAHKGIRPLWTIEDLDDNKMVEEWFENAVGFCERHYSDYFQLQLDNLLVYRGIQWLHQEKYANRFWEKQQISNRRSPRIVINHTWDAVEYWVSKLTRFRPAVAVNPANAESKDADDAKIAKDVLDYIWYINEIDRKNAELVRLAKITGEAFRFIEYDPAKGDLHPDYLQQSQSGQRTPLLGSNGEPILSHDGTPLFIQGAVRVGEVEERVVPGYHVFEEPAASRDKINWDIEWDVQHVDELRAQYPDLADQIKPDGGSDIFKNYGVNIAKGENDCIVYTLHHRHHPMLEKGRKIKRIKGLILESTELPYSHGKLPYIYLSDIDVPGQTRGMSFIQQTFPIQHQINACASLVYKALVLTAHPKIAMREGSCDITQLVNESTIVTYSDEPPSLMQMGGASGEAFAYLSKLEEIHNKISGQYTLSTGQAPSGVRAAKALRVIEDQEDKRAYYMAIKYNEVALVKDAKMVLATAGDFYDDSDGRLARVVGKNNEFRIRQFEVANLSKPYDIRIETTTALSQSPASKIEEIIELSQVQVGPNSPITREQLIKLLDLGNAEEFKDISSRAYTAANSENEDMRKGQPVPAPSPVEDLIVHWKTHIQQMQGRDFKEIIPEEARQLYFEHVKLTEYLMFKKAFGITDALGMMLVPPNPIFQQKMMIECPQWPLLFSQPPPGGGMMGNPMMGGGPVMPPGSPVDAMQSPGPIPPAAELSMGEPTGLPPMQVEPAPLR
jgi:hypothetical protein